MMNRLLFKPSSFAFLMHCVACCAAHLHHVNSAARFATRLAGKQNTRFGKKPNIFYKLHRRQQNGFTLIELVIFIVVIGIVVTAVMVPLTLALEKSPNPLYQIAAISYAQGRIELQIGQRRLATWSNYSNNLCTGGSQPANCSLTGYSGSPTTSVIGGYTAKILMQPTGPDSRTDAQLYTYIGTFNNGN